MSFKDWLAKPLYRQDEHPDIVAQRRLDRYEERRNRDETAKAAAITAAMAAAPAYFDSLRDIEATLVAGFSYEVVVNGNFLVLRWTSCHRKHGPDDAPLEYITRDHAHGLNLSAVTDINLRPGYSAQETGGRIHYHDDQWEFIGYERTVDFVGAGYRSYWTTVYENDFPVPAKASVVTFAGIDFEITVPFRLGDEFYRAILTAIATKGTETK